VYVANRLRPWYGDPAGPLHPAQIDFGPPIDYRSALWTESFVGGSSGGHIGPKDTGLTGRFYPLQLLPKETPGSVATIQLVQEVTPSSGLRILITARVLIDHLDTNALLGLWPTDSDPFTTGPDYGVFFACDDHEFIGTAITASIQSTGTLLRTSDGVFSDMAIVIHGLSTIEFLVFKQGAWRSTRIENNVPQVAMRLSFSVQRAGATAGYGALNSFDLRTEPIQRRS
jgi:hypothetical protein